MEKKIDIPKWDDSYCVGNQRIDHQHQYFLDLIKHINNSIDSESSPELIQNQFNEVTLYARFHFCSEENMMIENNYIDFDHHKELHEELIHEISNRITHFVINKISLGEIIKFLVDWFVYHTITEDKKFHQAIKGILS